MIQGPRFDGRPAPTTKSGRELAFSGIEVDRGVQAGDYEAAQVRYDATRAIFERAFGAEHVLAVHPLVGLAEVAVAQGRLDHGRAPEVDGARFIVYLR